MILVGLIAVCVGGYFGARWTIRGQERDECQKKLKALALVIHEFESRNGRMPLAYVNGNDGTPWHSWRVLILPCLGRQDLYGAYRFDEPWNGPNNFKLIDQMPVVFACPAEHGKPIGSQNPRQPDCREWNDSRRG